MMARTVGVLGAPSAAGAYGPGQERTPERLRSAHLIPALRAASVDARDLGDTVGAPFATDPGRPDAQNVRDVVRVAADVARHVERALREDDRDVLVVGGDCTIEVGSVAGAARGGGRVGLVYVDLDADLNTPASGDGRLDWMGVAHLLDVPGAVPELAGVGPRRPLLAPADVRLLGVANLTDAERATIDRLGLHVEGPGPLAEDPAGVAARTAEWAVGFDTVLVHVDVDVLDFDDFPLAENTRRGVGGLRFAELADLLPRLCALPRRRVLTVSEINLDHADDPDGAAARVVELLVAALAGP